MSPMRPGSMALTESVEELVVGAPALEKIKSPMNADGIALIRPD